MSATNEQIDRKLELLKLAEELGSISAACRTIGVSRDTFYRVRHAYSRGGIEALRNINRRKPNLKNRVTSKIEQAVLKLSIARPTYGQARVSATLAREGIVISPAGVRCIWLRHGVTRTELRKQLAPSTMSPLCSRATASVTTLDQTDSGLR